MLTGIQTLPMANMFGGLNNLNIYTVIHERMAERFGFTLSEVQELLRYYELEDSTASVKQWHSGYTFGTTHEIFNPWSVLRRIYNKEELDLYWINGSDNVLLTRLITKAPASTKKELILVLTDQPITKTIRNSMKYPDLDKQSELIWSLLLFSGYLTYETCVFDEDEGKKKCKLKIPNKRVKGFYNKLIKDIFIDLLTQEETTIVVEALIKHDTPLLSHILQKLILNSMSMYDLPNNEPEKSYHLFILGMLVMLSDHYEVKSNRESGYGRYDIMLIPKTKDKPGIVIEFKTIAAFSEEGLETAAQKALDQIIEKNYIQELKARDITNVVAYGIAFHNKNLLIKSTHFGSA